MLDKLGAKWVQIDLDAIRDNIDAIKRHVGKRSLMAVIKADAYGHGAVEVARLAESAGVRMLGVSSVDEAIQLRNSFIKLEILIFGVLLESQACDIINYHFTPTVCSFEFAAHLDAECARLGKEVDAHLCIDTGMGRVGPNPDEAIGVVKKIMKLEHIRLTGIYTHFSSADADYTFSRKQLDSFAGIVRSLDKEGLVIPFRHIANSAGILELDESYFDMVRPGLLIYGIYPYGSPGKGENKLVLTPALSLKTRVVFVKNVPAGTPISYGKTYITKSSTKIATLPIGYADGFSRSFSNAGQVLINGKRYTVSGNVCMDMMMVDVGDDDVNKGDEVVVIGRQQDEEITVYEIAQKLKTIPYEVISLIGKRIPRLYIFNRRPYALKKLFQE